MTDKVKFGPYLKGVCVERGMSRKSDIARFFGMSFQAADKIMQDWYNPSCDAMVRYLEKFGLELVVVQKGSKLPDGAVILDKIKMDKEEANE